MLSETGVFFVLGKDSVRRGKWKNRQRWVKVEQAWRTARDKDEEFPIIFGDAAKDSCGLHAWGVLDQVVIGDAGTDLRFTPVESLRGHRAEHMKKCEADGGGFLSPRRRSGYQLVQTPPFVTDSPEVSSKSSAEDPPEDSVTQEGVLRKLRKHQTEFRRRLLALYDGRCAIAGCDVECALEAAHISPHSKAGDNRLENGVLLRADIHALFDAGLLRIHPETLTVDLQMGIRDSAYGRLQGSRLASRKDGSHVSRKLLRDRWREPEPADRGN